MVEAEKPKWEFKPLHGRDILNTKSGAQLRVIAEMAAKSSGVSWKEVQNMSAKEFIEFTSTYARTEGLDEFGGYDFLEKE